MFKIQPDATAQECELVDVPNGLSTETREFQDSSKRDLELVQHKAIVAVHGSFSHGKSYAFDE